MTSQGKPLRIYIAGPYTHGDTVLHVREAILAGMAILRRGHVPFIPHLYHFAHLLAPLPYEQWILLDLRWLETCHGLLRLPGHSPGADREADYAKQLDMAIYYSLVDCLAALPTVAGGGTLIGLNGGRHDP